MSIDRESLLDHLYKVLRNDLPTCGCNQPEEGDRLVHALVSLAPFYENERWREAERLIGSPGAFQLVIGALTEAELLEHGNTMGGSWLGPRGRWFLWAVEQVGGIDLVDQQLDTAGMPHEYDPATGEMPACTAACWTVPSAPAQ